MKISLSEIKKYVPEAGKLETAELVRLIGSRLVEVEGTEDWGEKYQGIYAVKVVECTEIPDTHLHLCQVDAGEKLGREFGGGGEDGARDGSDGGARGAGAEGFGEAGKSKEAGEKNLVQVVCGAPNVRAGMWAAWIAPGSVVPETYGGENFRLGVRKLRGHESNGMLAALDELDLGTDHEGIIELNPEMAGLAAGRSLAELVGLDDVILEIENKSLTHRPDTFGLVGFAREVAGIMGVKFREPEWVARGVDGDTVSGGIAGGGASGRKGGAGQKSTEKSTWDLSAEVLEKLHAKNDTAVTVKIANAELCPRYSCAVMELNLGEQSPYLTRETVFLAKAGMRSISPIVDLTNIVMLETGQPLHAFDYDKFVKVGGGGAKQAGAVTEGAVIGVRAAREGEKLELLDGKVVECNENDILITSGEVPVALAGAMGGKNTEIDAGTRRIILEVATFSLYHLRKTQMAHGIFSEAITRFTKGQPAGMTGLVLAEAVGRLGRGEVMGASEAVVGSEASGSGAGAGVGAGVAEVELLGVVDEYPGRTGVEKIEFSVDGINSLLGADYSEKQVVATLENVGIKVEKLKDKGAGKSKGSLMATVPPWRTDLHIPEDIIEEVGRLNGYDNIPQTLPVAPMRVVRPEPMLALKSRVREVLSDELGMHEVLTYSFVSGRLLAMVGEKPENSYRIVNSISPELQYFRQSLVPSLVAKVPQNLKAGYRDFTLYEMNQVTEVSAGLNEEGVPVMQQRLAGVAVRDYYEVKAGLLALFGRMGAGVEVRKFSDDKTNLPYFEPGRSAELWLEGRKIGNLGELRTGVTKSLKIKPVVTGWELDLAAFLELKPEKKSFNLSKFPSVTRDLTLKIEREGVDYAEIAANLKGTLKNTGLEYGLEPVSIYQPDRGGARNYSFRITLTSLEKTLTAEEISDIMEKVGRGAKKGMGAEVV